MYKRMKFTISCNKAFTFPVMMIVMMILTSYISFFVLRYILKIYTIDHLKKYYIQQIIDTIN